MNRPEPEKKRCRLHGGAKGIGAQPGNKNALKHGYYSKAAITGRREAKRLLVESLDALNNLTFTKDSNMSEMNFNGLAEKLAVIDQDALVSGEFLAHAFHYDIGRFLVTCDGKTVACLVKESGQRRPDQFSARKTMGFSHESRLCELPHLPLADLVRMATEGEVTLALETESDGSECLVLTASAEKFDPDGEHVIVLKGKNQMRIGYQLYCADPSTGQKLLGGPIRDFEEFKSKEMERIG